MDILNIVKKGELIHSLWIQDGDQTYPVPLKALHNPIILSALEEDGWEFYDLPYDIRKGNITLESLPVVKFEDQHYTSIQEQDMVDITAHLFKEVDLKAKIRRKTADFYKWATVFPRINTREELINFLNVVGHSTMEIDRPESYMPLNSFVNKSALFTIDEYFAPENADNRSKIENRRRLSFKNFSRLINQFSKIGINEKSTPKEIVDKYFSWGICGININATSVRKEQVQMRLGSTVSGTEDRYKPYVTLSELSYLKADGSWNYNQNTQTWKPTMQETDMVRIINSLKSTGNDYIYPMLISTRVNDEITVINAEGLRVDYNESIMIYHYLGQDLMTTTLNVADLADSRKSLKQKNFNILNDSIQKDLFNELYTEALCKKVIDKITVKTDVSSYKALLASGCSPVSAISYVYHTGKYEDTVFSGLNLDKAVIVFTDEMRAYLRDLSLSKPELEPNLSEFVNDVIEGRVNIDCTYEGISTDASQSNTLLYNIIRVANKYLGISFSDIYQKIDEYNVGDEYVDLTGNGLSIRLPMHERRSALTGYETDLKYYMAKQAKEAVSWLFVLKACTFPGSEYSNKHIAVEVLHFDRSASKRIENYLDALIYEEIEVNLPMKERATALEMRPLMIARAIFSIYVHGEYKMPEQYGGRMLNISKGIISSIVGAVDTKFDSLLTICDTTTWAGGGEFVRYCVNAIITPEYVIPRGKNSIKEVPFMPMWINHANIQAAPGIRRNWIDRGFCSESHMGYAGIYERTDLANRGRQLIEISGYKVEDDPVSLLSFYQQADALRLKGISSISHLYSVYPKLMPEDWSNEKVVNADGSRFKWCSDTVQLITKQSMIDRDPEVAQLFGISATAISDKKQYGKFKEFDASDFLVMEEFKDLKMDYEFGSRVKVVSIYNDIVKFADGYSVNYKDIDTVDQDSYAVVQLCGRKYLAEDLIGALREINI